MTLPHEGSNCRGILGNKRLNEHNKGEDGRRMDERTNERLDSSRVSLDTPGRIGAYGQRHTRPRHTFKREKDREGEKSERDEIHEEDRVIPRDEGRRREGRFTQPSLAERKFTSRGTLSSMCR